MSKKPKTYSVQSKNIQTPELKIFFDRLEEDLSKSRFMKIAHTIFEIPYISLPYSRAGDKVEYPSHISVTPFIDPSSGRTNYKMNYIFGEPKDGRKMEQMLSQSVLDKKIRNLHR
jgi:hypothetical protein